MKIMILLKQLFYLVLEKLLMKGNFIDKALGLIPAQAEEGENNIA